MKGRLFRIGFLLVLAGGLVLFARARSPRDMVVEVDLTSALPGDIVETDVIVYREGRALARVDDRHIMRNAWLRCSGVGRVPGTTKSPHSS